MRQKTVDIGKITGMNTYEMAVAAGEFTGTAEEYLQKELRTYLDMVSYADQAKIEMNKKIANITDSNVDMAEVTDARSTFNTLGDRLSNTDDSISDIISRLNNIVQETTGDVVKDVYFEQDTGYVNFVVETKENIPGVTHDNNARIIEMRNTGTTIQWRYRGFQQWADLLNIKEMIPQIQAGKITMVEPDQKPSMSISGTVDKPVLNLDIPRGKNGGDIINARINELGELIITVTDSTLVDKDNVVLPVVSLGKVETLDEDAEAVVTITGTATNPIFNFGIPRGKSVKNVSAIKDENGMLKFDFT